MVPALIALIGVVVAVCQLVSARTDWALAHQEVDLIKKLQRGSHAANDLEMIISKRIGSWRGRHEASRVTVKWSAGLAAIASLWHWPPC